MAQTFEGLLKQLQCGDDETEMRAAKRLGEMGDRRAVEPLVAAYLKCPSFSVSRCILEALARLVSPGDERIMTQMLPPGPPEEFDPLEKLSLQRILALGALGDARAVQALITCARLHSGKDAEVSFQGVPSYPCVSTCAVGAVERILERDGSKASSEALRAALSLQGIKSQSFPHSEHDQYRGIMEEVDCSKVHHLAREELARRSLSEHRNV